jgi:hypothetical protein
MTHGEIRALAAGFAPVIQDYVCAEISKVNASLSAEIAQLRAEFSDLRAKVGFDERITALEAKVEQRSNVRRIA